jgi:predicted AlkP superfamily pyrophosphatase or phosphodiesterase
MLPDGDKLLGEQIVPTPSSLPLTAAMLRRVALRIVFVIGLSGCAGRLPPPVETAPLVILISFDGFRWDYDTRAPAPNLRRLAAGGVRAAGLIPGHPSKTIPNHYSIVTGLYPAHHGMVANTIRDPVTGRLFERTNRAEVQNPMWWGGDPIWNLAQRAGLVAATMFWAGSDAPIGGMRPRHWREFDDSVPPSDRVDQVLAWLDLPPAERPSLVTLYLNDTDTMGHFYGPDSQQVRTAITAIDAQLGRVIAGLERRGLFAHANLVVVSDHGMAPTRQDRTIVADDFVPLADVDIVDINPTLGLAPRPGTEDRVYRAVAGAHPHLKMYRRAETPEHWRFRDQPRVPAITGVADEGWVVIRRADAGTYWRRSPDGGQHGYDPRLESMRGIFVASGPAFKQGITVPAFENVNVHSILAMALGLAPSANDGDPAIARRVLR